MASEASNHGRAKFLPTQVKLALPCLFALHLLGSAPAAAQGIDPHALYEQRCAGCHKAHAGDFVPVGLERMGDKVVGSKTGQELRALLESGHGRLAPDEIEAVVAHLTFVLQAGGLFRTKCGICHDRASELARATLLLHGNRLVGRYSGRDVAEFLASHGRLEPEEIDIVLAALKGQLARSR